jgi:HEAT repeat protein
VTSDEGRNNVHGEDQATLLWRLRDRSHPPEERAAAVRNLVIRDVQDATDGLLCEIFLDEHEDPAVRCAAAEALGGHEATAAMAVNVLTRAVQATRKERPVRRAAVAALRARGRVPARMEAYFQEALERLRRPGDPLEGSTIVNMAGSFGYDPRAVAALRDALRNANPQLRIGAVHSLAQLGETDAVLGALDDPAPEVRAWAARALGYYGLGEARELAALERTRVDADASVVEAATVSLRRLGALPIRRPGGRRRRAAGAAGDDPRLPWRPLLERWSREWLQDADYAAELPDAVVESSWLGYPPASEEQIAAAERRLGTTLPPSYRAFLRVTNGWRRTSPFIERLWGTEELEWLSVRNQDLVDIWTADEMPDCWEQRAFPHALEVSDWGDSALYVLHPGAVRADGEWEAAFFANWSDGAQVYGSFWELMQEEYASFLRLRHDGLA